MIAHAFRATDVPPNLVLSVPYFRMRKFNAIRLFSRRDLDERVAQFLAIMRSAPKPLYLHCHLGVDRALVLAAAYRILIQGLDPRTAIEDMRALHSPWFPVEARYLRSLTGARQLHILQQVEYWTARVRPTGEIRCSQGRCRYLGTLADL